MKYNSVRIITSRQYTRHIREYISHTPHRFRAGEKWLYFGLHAIDQSANLPSTLLALLQSKYNVSNLCTIQTPPPSYHLTVTTWLTSYFTLLQKPIHTHIISQSWFYPCKGYNLHIDTCQCTPAFAGEHWQVPKLHIFQTIHWAICQHDNKHLQLFRDHKMDLLTRFPLLA